MLYALGALSMANPDEHVERVSMAIHQPRRHHFDEWECGVEELMVLADRANTSAVIVNNIGVNGVTDATLAAALFPGEKQCRFCKAKATCPALRDEIAKEVFDSFDALETTEPRTLTTKSTSELLGIAMGKVDLIEGWCKAVRETTHVQMMSGVSIPGQKLVQGRAGNRAWIDENQAEQAFKKMRFKKEEMYSYKIISPTVAAKMLEKRFPRRWKELQSLITRSDGHPVVAPVSDKRPAIELEKAEDMFDAIVEVSIDDLL